MQRKTVLQLGAGILLVHSIRLLREIGLRVYAADRDPQAPGFGLADGSAPVDIGDLDGIERYAREIGADAILAVNEAGVLAAAQASQRLGLRNLSPEVALRCLDKGRMRDCWCAAGLPQPSYEVTEDERQIPKAADRIGYPVILKPAMNWGSRGVSYVAGREDLDWAIEFARAHNRNRRFIVEECVSGTEMTIEGLVREGHAEMLAKSDKVPQEDPRYRVAMVLNYPAQFSARQLARADEVVAGAVRALGLEHGAFHCECMVNEQGVFLLELGGRPGGGHIFGQIVEAVSGICMPQALARIFLGEPVDIKARFQRGACYRFFAPPPGVFLDALGLEEARALPGILDFGFSLPQGTRVAAIAGDADRPGFVVAAGATREEAMKNAARAVATIRYRMQE